MIRRENPTGASAALAAGLVVSLAAMDAGLSGAAAQECTLGDIKMFAGNFAPRNYMLAQGQTLSIAQNQSLYSLFGTQYGGDGRTTFSLPDLRGRAPMGVGSGSGLTPRTQGQKLGTESYRITAQQTPSHTHGAVTQTALRATDAGGTVSGASGAALADDGSDSTYQTSAPNTTLAVGAATSTTTLGQTGGDGGVNNMQPSLAINYIVCISGIFPSRS